MSAELDPVARWRVTTDNPPREAQGLDYERCAALHNAIVTHACTAHGLPTDQLETPTWWDHQGQNAEAVRSRLHPSLVEFLRRARLLPENLSFFYYLHSLNSPKQFWFSTAALDGDRFLTLYVTHAELASKPDGLIYDQEDHEVRMNFSIEDLAVNIDHGWNKLETVLSIYLDMIERGKAVALPRDMFNQPHIAVVDNALQSIPTGPEVDPASGARLYRSHFKPWVLVPYTAHDLQQTLELWNRLVDEIEKRIPGRAVAAETEITYGLLNAAQLEVARIPPQGFIYELLSRVRRPRDFVYIAPGMRLPSVDEFVLQQPFGSPPGDADAPAHLQMPIMLFRADGELVPVPKSTLGWPCNTVDRVTPGLYLDAWGRDEHNVFADACFTLLPFAVPRKLASRPTPLGLWSMPTLNPFIMLHRTQLRAVIENMYFNVVEGNWAVDENGVAGGLDVFRRTDEVDFEERYGIPFGLGGYW